MLASGLDSSGEEIVSHGFKMSRGSDRVTACGPIFSLNEFIQSELFGLHGWEQSHIFLFSVFPLKLKLHLVSATHCNKSLHCRVKDAGGDFGSNHREKLEQKRDETVSVLAISDNQKARCFTF